MVAEVIAVEEMSNNVQIQRVGLAKLIMDKYQRPMSLPQIKKIANEFDPALCLPLVVNLRRNGDMACVDGQHRAKALLLRDGMTATWDAQVNVGLSYEEEAKLFVELNRKRREMNVRDAFHAAIEAKDEQAMTIVQIVNSCGYEIKTRSHGSTPTSNAIQSIGALLHIHNNTRAGTLQRVLSLLAEAYGNRPAPESTEIRGLAQFLTGYDQRVDERRVLDVLTRMTLATWRAEAIDFKRVMGGDEFTAAVHVLRKRYNNKLRADRQLPVWGER